MRNSLVTNGGFRLGVPYCWTSRITEEYESAKETALAALRGNIFASDGTVHGPRNEYPAEFETEKLTEHVGRITVEGADWGN